MADYISTFNHVFTKSEVEVDIFNVDINTLGCWQTLQQAGFEPAELLTIFRQQYCVEIWQQIKGECIRDQFVADLLFKAAVRGYLESLLLRLQNAYSLPCNGMLCNSTLYILNHGKSCGLDEWLVWSIVYLDSIQSAAVESNFVSGNHYCDDIFSTRH